MYSFLDTPEVELLFYAPGSMMLQPVEKSTVSAFS